jgi:heme exporter protein A
MTASNPPPALDAMNLRCERGDRTLFEGLCFQVAAGQLLQIEGANGSGKTTLLRTLCGLFEATAGEVVWCGQSIRTDPANYHAQLSYIGHLPGIKLELSPQENLAFSQGLRGQRPTRSDILGALDAIGLFGFEELPCRQLSAGQRRRVALARLLLENSLLWILDEPFTALDRAGNERLSELLVAHLLQGGLVVLTSHQPVSLREITITRLALE